MTKRILALALTLVMVLPLLGIGAVAASSQPTVQPRWTNTMMLDRDVYGVSGYGEAYVDIIGFSYVTYIEGTITVYVQNGSSWDYVTENTDSASTSQLYLSAEFDSVKGAYYRADYTINVYAGEVCETISDSIYGTAN